MKIRLEVWTPDGLHDLEVVKNLALTPEQEASVVAGDPKVIRKIFTKEAKAYTKFSNIKEVAYNSTFKCASAEQDDILCKVKFIDIAPKELIYG
jgi:hypothetical protein